MVKKPQIFFIKGGMTFKNRKDYLDYLKNRKVSIKEKKRWHGEYLKNKLGKNFDIIKIRMPLSDNAKYEDWKIVFENYIPFMKNNVILIGSSLGGIFLAKYLSENKLPKKISAVYMIAPPFDNSLLGEDLVGGFVLKTDLSLIEKNCKNINLLFSKNDDCVPVFHAEKYRKKLKNANIKIYDHVKGHFEITEFPEIVKMIKANKK